ncbi:MAG: hypothetical protein UU95_C0002G0067 [Parcubacteria group bacterium GW2011_GWC2_42_12]|uniref:Capsule synthesis protein CapA domain-containing protein n=2 Tax=Candidatus Falkowiibacteriota TaxID=1752728 RepID=A0A1F5S803_9BACT|nr:MAG: hypothetical protein UU43_C0008G0003 [Candidatus Falkowbacteria bacterium GW2011_GWA2_41_14]KKS35361.1 MAG: hypothetical protein UU95_C0002G0067 [Parcubacteria group bacterium GW2011_GWC2_42_12]OGF22844.1 MAG: hypothetical protein A3D45_02850 [Candidatus Falkowbacteria bacterium RIFCSPHIGHO2_02_FULL_42_9]
MKKYRPILSIAAAVAFFLIAVCFLAFYFLARPNSGFLAQNIKTADKPAQVNNELSFSFAGDAMFGRNIGYYFQKNNFQDLFVNLDASVFQGTDIFWLNLEGPISDKNVEQFPLEHSLVFNFSRQTIEALKYLKIIVVGLANNHTMNQGAAALKKTREILEREGIDWSGDPNKNAGESIKRYRQGDITVALLPVNTLANTGSIEELIKQEKDKNNFVIVLPHWGNEYEIFHNTNQENLAKDWIAAGADLIIGTHPHVVQDAQLINGKLVFYSLGNFIFDQMFSEETQEGLIISGLIRTDKIEIILTPVVSKKMKPEIMRGAERQKIIDRICQKLGEYCQGEVIEILAEK